MSIDTNRARSARHLRVLAAAAALSLAGCGGGGDEQDEDQATGLVPTAPTLGATLFNQAGVLRPLVDGAQWHYAGVDDDGRAYVNVVTHAGAQVGVTESSTNLLALGAHATHVVAVNGNIVQPDPVDATGDGVPDFADLLELRSPVRVNDQFVVFDRRLAGAVPDLDGDGRGESLDVAIYSRVLGTEDVVLAGLPTQQAVRIDRTSLTRVVLSKDGQKLPTVSTITSTWYAPSVGIVRRRFDRPSDDGVGREQVDERASGWSGL